MLLESKSISYGGRDSSSLSTLLKLVLVVLHLIRFFFNFNPLQMSDISVRFAIAGSLVAVASGLHTSLFTLISARQTTKIRQAYLRAILRQVLFKSIF